MGTRITQIGIYPILATLTRSVAMSSGNISQSGNVLVEVTTANGISGWGEGVEAPALTGETQAMIESDLRRLTPLLMGVDATSVAEVWQLIDGSKGGAARAAIDIACHDLAGKILGFPAFEFLGGAARVEIPALTLVGTGQRHSDLTTLIEQHSAGFRWFKVKVALGRPAEEAETARAAVDLVGSDSVVCVDANEGWSEDEANDFLVALGDAPILYVEQPVGRHDVAGLRRLATAHSIPLCADESAPDLGSLRGLKAVGFSGVSLKLIKHGGMTGVMAGGRAADRSGLAVNLAGKVAETSIAAAANLHCAAALARLDFGCSPAHQGLRADVTAAPPAFVRGVFRVPSRPGLGVDVDLSMVKAIMGHHSSGQPDPTRPPEDGGRRAKEPVV